LCPLVVSISLFLFGFGWRVPFHGNQLLASSARCTKRAASYSSVPKYVSFTFFEKQL
jgi:hypothetical protein